MPLRRVRLCVCIFFLHSTRGCKWKKVITTALGERVTLTYGASSANTQSNALSRYFNLKSRRNDTKKKKVTKERCLALFDVGLSPRFVFVLLYFTRAWFMYLGLIRTYLPARL